MKGVANVNLTQLRYFVEVGKSLNISATARKLHVSQPAISRSLRDLETELGVELLTRQGRHLVLTSQGSFFLSAAHQFFSQLMNASDNVKKIQPENENQITIKMQQTTPLLVPFIQLIKKELPKIRLDIIQSDLTNASQPIDFQLVSAPLANQVNELLLKEEVCLAVSKTTFHKHSIAQSDLNGFPLLQLDESPFADMVKSYLTAQDIHPHYLLKSGDRGLLLHLVETGYGGCLVPNLSWKPLINKDKVDLLHVGRRGFHRQIFLSYPQGPRTQTQQAVAKLLVNYCHHL